MLNYILLVTTDGNRPTELNRLFESIPAGHHILIALLEQCGSETIFPPNKWRIIRLSSPERIPLSVARNRLLDHLSKQIDPDDIGPETRLILSDDDCWYSPDFFNIERKSIAHGAILVHPAFDPSNGRAFAVTDVRKLPCYTQISPEQLLYCATSIGIDMPASLGLRLRFNEKIGLGCKISQGEETLYLFHALGACSEIKVLSLNEASVFHPHKIAKNSHNHYSLAYFLGWCASGPYPYTARYFRYKFFRSLAALLLRPSALSFSVPFALLKGYFSGQADHEQLGSPTAPNHLKLCQLPPQATKKNTASHF